MSKRKQYLESFYNSYDERSRLSKSRHGQLEYATTMHYIHKFIRHNDKVMELGIGAGKYSITLAKEGFDVTSIELVENNLKVLKENSKDIKNI